MTKKISHVLVPGTFDPITFGHMDVVRRALRICPRVTVAVAESLGKNGVGTTFTLDERVVLARRALDGMDGVDVMPFTGLLVDFAREVQADAVVKGLRAIMTKLRVRAAAGRCNYRLDAGLQVHFRHEFA